MSQRTTKPNISLLLFFSAIPCELSFKNERNFILLILIRGINSVTFVYMQYVHCMYLHCNECKPAKLMTKPEIQLLEVKTLLIIFLLIVSLMRGLQHSLDIEEPSNYVPQYPLLPPPPPFPSALFCLCNSQRRSSAS